MNTHIFINNSVDTLEYLCVQALHRLVWMHAHTISFQFMLCIGELQSRKLYFLRIEKQTFASIVMLACAATKGQILTKELNVQNKAMSIFCDFIIHILFTALANIH